MALTEIPIELSSTPSIVDGGNAMAITIDSSENVGIGTSLPNFPLQLDSSRADATFDANNLSTWADFKIQGDTASGNARGIYFDFDSDTGNDKGAGIVGISGDAGGGVGSLAFITTAGNVSAERMRIDSSGHVTVGTTDDAPGAGNTLAGVAIRGGSDNRSFLSANANYVLHLNRNTSDGVIQYFAKNGTAIGSIGALGGSLMIGGGDVGIGFYQGSDALVPSNGVTATRDNAIDLGMSDSRFKDIFLSGGVNFSANANAGGMTSELLDDYEEGTWTPTVTTSSGSISYAAQQAAFVKVGNVVHYWIRLVATCTATATLYNLSLPFSTSGYNVFYAGPAVANAYNVTLGSGGTVLGGYYINSNNAIRMHSYGNNTGQVSPSVTANTAFELRMEGSYRVAA